MRRPSYASVTSTLALFIALSGGAYAATALPVNSVGPRQIKKSAVERGKLKNNAVDSSKVLDNTLTGEDIRESQLETVPEAALADTASDADHATVAAGLDKVTYKSAAAPAAADIGGEAAATAVCDAGQRVVGGGVRIDNRAVALVLDSSPDVGGGSWTARVGTWDVGSTNFTVTAICVPANAG
jgi:hypothetical protein